MPLDSNPTATDQGQTRFANTFEYQAIKAMNALEEASTIDELTGLFNFRHFKRSIENLEQSGRHAFVIVSMDLDGLKIVNDSNKKIEAGQTETIGHNAGDKLLVATAQVIRASFRDVDIIARKGGDEFAAILIYDIDSLVNEYEKHRKIQPELTLAQYVDMGIAYQLSSNINAYNDANPGAKFPMSLSWGTALSMPSIDGQPHHLLRTFETADIKMYADKDAKKE